MLMQVFIERAQTLLHTTSFCPLILSGSLYLEFKYLDELMDYLQRTMPPDYLTVPGQGDAF